MPAERVSMRRVREILRLKHECGAPDRAIARSLGIARSTVAVTLDRLAVAELVWPLPASLSDRVLEAMLYAGPGTQRGSRRKAEPDWTHVHHELRRPGVTLMLLWEEYRQREPGGYGYSRWCELYRGWEGRLSPTMRQSHPAGERMFVDYAGQTVELYDGRTGEIRAAQIFVAVMGAPATPMPRRAGRRRCPTGLARTSGRSPSWVAHRRSWYPTTQRSASPAPTGTSRVSTGPISIWRPITARRSCRHGRANRATKPRSKLRNGYIRFRLARVVSPHRSADYGSVVSSFSHE